MEIKNIKDNIWRMTPPKVITFVGPRGVGKTSLLASLHGEFKKNCVQHLALDDQKTILALDNTLGAMKSMLADPAGTIIRAGRGIEGSSEKTEFCFKISGTEKNKVFEFPLTFVDLPGKWYEETDHEEDFGAILLDSSVSFLVVDAPALMGNAKHRRLNKTGLIDGIYSRYAAKLATQNHLVVIVLTRCEAWTCTGKTQKLLDTFHKHYQPTIDMLKANGIKVVETWVNTLGGARFVKMDVEQVNGQEVFSPKFMCTGEYKPENCEQPLVYALDHVASIIIKEIQEHCNDWWVRILIMLGIDPSELAKEVITRALKEITPQIKQP